MSIFAHRCSCYKLSACKSTFSIAIYRIENALKSLGQKIHSPMRFRCDRLVWYLWKADVIKEEYHRGADSCGCVLSLLALFVSTGVTADMQAGAHYNVGEDSSLGLHSGTISQVSAGGTHTFGVESDGTTACWGDDIVGQATPPGVTFRIPMPCKIRIISKSNQKEIIL